MRWAQERFEEKRPEAKIKSYVVQQKASTSGEFPVESKSIARVLGEGTAHKGEEPLRLHVD